MTHASSLLFVYGTLRRGGGHPMGERLTRCATWRGAATTSGRLFDTGRYPAAVAACEDGEIIHGELYEIDEPENVWPWLDEYEGYFPGDEADSLFVRRLALVRLANDGKPEHAWMYWYSRAVDGLPHVAGGRYYSRLAR